MLCGMTGDRLVKKSSLPAVLKKEESLFRLDRFVFFQAPNSFQELNNGPGLMKVFCMKRLHKFTDQPLE